MAILDLAGLTMNAEEAQEVSKLIYEATITGGQLAEYHEIEQGIHHKTQIPFIGNLDLVGVKQTGCDRTLNPSTIPLTEKFWDPELIGDRLKHCVTDVNALLKLFKKSSRVNPDFYDRIDGEEFGVIIAKVAQAMEKMNNRIVWFGDKAADNVSGGGVITNGTDPAYFDILDGLWKQIITEVPAGATNHVNIVENEAATKVLQDTLAADTGYKTLKAMYNATDARFFEAMQDGAQAEFLITRALAQNWEDYLETTSLAFSLLEVKEGTDRLRYRGIPIKIKNDWDSNIRAYMDNGTTWNLPHRALLTVKENIPVGTVATEDLDTITSWYEKKDHANYIDFDLKLDAKHLLPYMTVAAY